MVTSLRESLSKSFNDRMDALSARRNLYSQKHALSDSVEFRKNASSVVPYGSIQSTLRPLFGKEGVVPPSIGDHPDFVHLRGTDNFAYAPTVTLFMDIANSTRLGLLYDLVEVKEIKNAFIQCAIELVHAFDGHVHRIMGDAVMAFFGGMRDANQCVVDALNCAAILEYLAAEVVNPRLEKKGYKRIGIRVGLDYGPSENVLWSSYGYPGSEEVTATSFFVDIASKLQHDAGLNQIMLGQSLVEFIDLPSDLLAVKTVQRNYVDVEDKFVTAYLLPDDTRLSYRKWLFNWEKYLELMASSIPGMALPSVSGSPLAISADYLDDNGELIGGLPSCAIIVPKNRLIRFRLHHYGVSAMMPLSIKCVVENHGKQAEAQGDLTHKHEYRILNEQQWREFSHNEGTLYRGLHYLNVTVRSDSGVTFQGRHAVYVA